VLLKGVCLFVVDERRKDVLCKASSVPSKVRLGDTSVCFVSKVLLKGVCVFVVEKRDV
jgi:hypothetical protein